MRQRAAPILCLTAITGSATADSVLYRYEGDVLPTDAGWTEFDPCKALCDDFLSSGHYIAEWHTAGHDVLNLDHRFTDPREDFWAECSFSSNLRFVPFDPACDGGFTIGGTDSIDLHGDAAVSFGGGSFIGGLALNEFHTFRFERRIGKEYTFSADGRVFVVRADAAARILGYIQITGHGVCDRPDGIQRNMWDHVRYGTLSEGELIVSSDPPSGIVNAATHPNLDRFTITFDQPAYVYVDDVVVTSTGSPAPQVQWTRRLDNGAPETVEIVLDRALPVDATTTFTFDDGVAVNVVEYTYVALQACCLGNSHEATLDASRKGQAAPRSHEGKVETSKRQNIETGYAKASNGDANCVETSEEECAALGGSLSASAACEGDADGDGVDGVCGDGCPDDAGKVAPGQCGCGAADTDFDGDAVADCIDGCANDPAKTEPGECGCGNPDTDTDDDTVADCLDQCDGEDDTLDEDGDGIPDCLQFQPIPTTTAWGVGIMSLLLLIAAKVRGFGPTAP